MKQIEKTTSLITIVMALFMLVSCSKETNYKNRIVGQWMLTSHTNNYYDENGSFLGSGYGFWILTGQVTEFTSNGSIMVNGSSFGTYTIQDETLTIESIDFASTDFSIESLTSSELRFKRENKNVKYVYCNEYNEVLGVFYGCTQVIEYVFEREK